MEGLQLQPKQEPGSEDNTETDASGETEVEKDESETNLFHQSVLMDHEYEFYTAWNDFMEGITITEPDAIDHGNGIGMLYPEIQMKVEIGDDSRIFNHPHGEDDKLLERSGIDLEIPPSPATASLQELLQLAYKETQVEEAQDSIPYDEHQAAVNEQGDGQDLNLDIFGEIEAISSPHQGSSSEITSGELSTSKNGCNRVLNYTGFHQSPSPTYAVTDSSKNKNYHQDYIKCSSERSERYTNGLKHIAMRVKRMRMRTGAATAGTAEYEGEQYCFEACSNSFRVLDDTNISEIPTSGDDHRYAAQIVTQCSSSAVISDHQYENRGPGVAGVPITQELSIRSQFPAGSAQITSKPSFEKRTYERNKSFQGHLHGLFSEIVKKLEDHTGATISLNVSYQNEVFTKLNYEDAAHIFQKRKDRKKRRISPVPVKIHNRRRALNTTACLQYPSKDVPGLKPGTFCIPINTGHSRRALAVSINSSKPLNDQPVPEDSSSRMSSNDLNSSSSGPSSSLSSMSLGQESSLPDICNQSQSRLGSINPTQHCLKCHSSTPLTGFGKTGGFIAWVRCSDPFCAYLVHAACLGFYVTSRESLKQLPNFYCEAHRD